MTTTTVRMLDEIPDGFGFVRDCDGPRLYTSQDPAEANTAVIEDRDGGPVYAVDVSGHDWKDLDGFLGAALQEIEAFVAADRARRN